MGTQKDVPSQCHRERCASCCFYQGLCRLFEASAQVRCAQVSRHCEDRHIQGARPYDEDWFYTRAASVARKIYLRKGTGVGALKKWYGGSSGTHRGTRKGHFSKASGSIIRKAMHELEKLEMMEHCSDGGHIITNKGRAEMDRIAGNITLNT